MKCQILFVAVTSMLLPASRIEAGGKGKPDAKSDVLKCVESYVKAFNKGDAKAVAAHWSETGEYVSADGERVTGRAAIEKAMTELFTKRKGLKLEVTVHSVRFVKPDVALEEGTATVTKFGEEPDKTSYSAIHVLVKGEWRLDSIRETIAPAAPTGADILESLDWMLGEWISETKGEATYVKCSWTANRAFLTMSFQSGDRDKIDQAGTGIVGWDPAKKLIRGWIFDSDGGFGEGVWTQKGKSWHVQIKATLPDGRIGTATSIYTVVDNNHISWQSVNRQVDGEVMPNVGPVVLVRKKSAKTE